VADSDPNSWSDALDSRVRAARQSLATTIGPGAPDVAGVHARLRRQRLAAAVAAVALVVAAVIGAGVLGAGTDDARSPVTAGEPDVGRPGVGNVGLLDPGEVRPMAESPLEGRSTMAAVWTGREMIVWGGEAPRRVFADGAAYDPVTDTWRMLATGPLIERNAPAVVWTGEEVLLWGGHSSDGGKRDGAAYDPASDTWRTLADAPIASDGLPQAVWTGEEMLVVAGFNSEAAAAYNPTSDTWRRMPPVPGRPIGPETKAAWTGTHMVVHVAYRSVDPSLNRPGGIVAYDPTSDTWALVPPPGGDNASVSSIVFTGNHLVQVNQSPGALIARYDFDDEAWTGIARWPDGQPPMETAAWTGEHVVLWGNGSTVVIDPDTGAISSTAGGSEANRTQPAAVWADGVLIIWGGFEDMDDGFVLRPERPVPSATDTTVTVPAATSAAEGRRVPVMGPDGTVGYLDTTPGPVEVNGRLLPVQRVLDDDGNLVGYFACSFLTRDVVEDPNFDASTACSTVTTSQGG
jgi:hypothetical protein